MKITNLCFADDLLMFARGDIEFFKLVMEKIRLFIAAIELKVSLAKSKIYFGGVEEETQRNIQEECFFYW